MAAMGAVKGPAIRKATAWLLASTIAGILTLTAGVVIANSLGGQRSPQTWARMGDVGESFGAISAVLNGLALTALIVTFWLQYQELRIQRAEAREQALVLARSDGELHRTAEAALRGLHLELLKMSIDDPDLAEVWPALASNTSQVRNKQFLYANLIFQYQWTAFRTGDYSESDVMESLRYLFTSPIMREYWEAARFARSALVVDSPEHQFTQKIDRLCEQYDVVTRATRTADLEDRIKAA